MGVAVGGWWDAEPAFAGTGEDALFGVAELAAELLKAQVGVEHEALGGVAAGVIDQVGEGGVFGGQAPLQGFGVHSDMACDVGKGDRAGW